MPQVGIPGGHLAENQLLLFFVRRFLQIDPCGAYFEQEAKKASTVPVAGRILTIEVRVSKKRKKENTKKKSLEGGERKSDYEREQTGADLEGTRRQFGASPFFGPIQATSPFKAPVVLLGSMAVQGAAFGVPPT